MTVKVGEVYRWDFQSDVYGGQYKVIAHLGGDRYEIEDLPADDQTIEAIFDYWAAMEADGAMTSPIWDKQWSECDEAKGEHPQRIGWKTYEQMLEEDLARYAERAGRRSVCRFISAARYAEYF